MRKTCGDCRHAAANPADPLAVQSLVCLRYPPTPTPIQAASGVAVMSMYPPITRAFPACGEFQEGGVHAAS
jgi:hypothetical protein